MAVPTIFILNYINQLGNTTNYFGPENMPQGLGISFGSNFPIDSRLIPGLGLNPTFQGNALFSVNTPAPANPAFFGNQPYPLNPTIPVNPQNPGNHAFPTNIPAPVNLALFGKQAHSSNPTVPSYTGHSLFPANIPVATNSGVSGIPELSLKTTIPENPPNRVNIISDRPISTDSTTKPPILVSPLIPTSSETPSDIEVSSLKPPNPIPTTGNLILPTNIPVQENPALSENPEFSLTTTIPENPLTRVSLTSDRPIPTDSTTKPPILVSPLIPTSSETPSDIEVSSLEPPNPISTRIVEIVYMGTKPRTTPTTGNPLLPSNIPRNPELSVNPEFSLNTTIPENLPTRVNLTSDRPMPPDSTTKPPILVLPLIPTSSETPSDIEVSSLETPNPIRTTGNPILPTNIPVQENLALSGNPEFSLKTTIPKNPPTRVLTSDRPIPTDSTTKPPILVSPLIPTSTETPSDIEVSSLEPPNPISTRIVEIVYMGTTPRTTPTTGNPLLPLNIPRNPELSVNPEFSLNTTIPENLPTRVNLTSDRPMPPDSTTKPPILVLPLIPTSSETPSDIEVSSLETPNPIRTTGNPILPTNIPVQENLALSGNPEFSLKTTIPKNPPTRVNLTSDRPMPPDSTTKPPILVSPLIPTSSEAPSDIEVSSLEPPNPIPTTGNPILPTNIPVPENLALAGNPEFSLTTIIPENPPTRVNLTSDRPMPTDSTTKLSILVSHITPRISSTTAQYSEGECFPQPGICGQQNDDDIYEYHNSFTKIDRNPWNVLLEYDIGYDKSDFFCGGTLITNRYVITSASCVVNLPTGWSLIGVRLGEWDIDASIDCDDTGMCADPSYDIAIDKVIPHEEYNPYSQDFVHDIALLRLASRIRFTKFVSPICLPIGLHLRNVNYTGVCLEVAGWARSLTGFPIIDTKLRDVVNGITLEECNTFYNQWSVEIQDSICVADIDSDVTCSEDVGGPLIIRNQENTLTPFYYLAGIGSMNVAPCDVSYPGVYTRVGSYIDWIENLVC